MTVRKDGDAALPSSQRTTVFCADQVITPTQVLSPGWVEVCGGRIAAVGAGSALGSHEPQVMAAGHTIVPGLVEMHVHGSGGADMTALDPSEIRRACIALLATGVTSTVVSLVTAPLAELALGAAIVADLVHERADNRARIVGTHFEGPFLSPEHRGAHHEQSLCLPDDGATRRILEAARGTMRMMTLAPELPGSHKVLRILRNQGVTAAMGHTRATYDETRLAIDGGVSVATHLFNGMPSSHHRAPGPALSLLDDARVTVELINDGVHVHPVVARVAVRAAHAGRLALISDGVAATGAVDGDYMLGRTAIRSRNGLVENADGSSLGGGTLTLDACVARAVHTLGMSLADAIVCATIVPAQALGIADYAGKLASGRDADLCVLDAELCPVGVMLGGRWVIEPPQRHHGPT